MEEKELTVVLLGERDEAFDGGISLEDGDGFLGSGGDGGEGLRGSGGEGDGVGREDVEREDRRK